MNAREVNAAHHYITAPVNASARQRMQALVLTGITLLALIFVRLFNPVGSGLYPPCIFHKFTGLYCPGCGSTRALYHLVHGHPAAAFAMNPLLVILLPVLVYAFLSYALMGLRGRGLPKIFVHPTLIKLLFWVAVAFGILRNLPFSPFNLLAPHTL
jgi:amino acid transporter